MKAVGIVLRGIIMNDKRHSADSFALCFFNIRTPKKLYTFTEIVPLFLQKMFVCAKLNTSEIRISGIFYLTGSLEDCRSFYSFPGFGEVFNFL